MTIPPFKWDVADFVHDEERWKRDGDFRHLCTNLGADVADFLKHAPAIGTWQYVGEYVLALAEKLSEGKR